MSDPEKTVFISYRRSTSQHLARIIHDRLTANGYDVFLDTISINSGEFGRIIPGQIASRVHFIVLLSVAALERCVKSDDWVRREIEFAIERKRNIVPIMLDCFSFTDGKSYLTGQLAELSKINGLNLYSDYLDEAIERLMSRFLKQPVYVDITEPSPTEKAAAERRVQQSTAKPAPTQKQLSAEKYNNEAIARKARGDIDGAIEYYTQAIELEPNEVRYFNRGIAYKAKSDLDSAIADYTQAIYLEPTYVKAYINRAYAYADKGNFELAIADCNESIRLRPDYANAYDSRGDILRAKGNLEGALIDYQKFLELNDGKKADQQQRVEQKIADLKKQLGR